ncbi:MAG: class I SAM-dependent methyltransferase [Vicinamibacterales bacterium]
MDLFRYDFGYAWPWTWGHLIAAAILAVATVGLASAGRRRWSLVTAALTIWAIAGAIIVNGLLRFSLPEVLPTAQFLTGGEGRVLDLGAGSGRSTLMVLLGRPAARVTALDIFGTQYGIVGNSPDRLLANAKAAGALDRVEVKVGDMRAMPFDAHSYDAAVSVAAIDHLNREGVEQTFAEVQRVLKPNGDFLLMVINQDTWIRTAFPMLAHHGYFGGRANPDRWRDAMTGAGLTVVESGLRPGMLWILARTPAASAAR